MGQDSAALSGRFIVPPDRHCQRLLSTNRRNTWRNLATQRSLDFGGVCAVLEPQSCDVLAYRISTESPDASGGCRGSFSQGTGDLNVPVAFSKQPRDIERPARHSRSRLRPFLWLLIPGPACDAPCSPIAPSAGENLKSGRAQVLIVCY